MDPLLMYRIVLSTLIGAISGGGSPVRDARAVTPDLSFRDTLPTVVVSLDTETFAPGNTDFTRFTAPGMCLGAAEEARDVARRSIAAQIRHVFLDSATFGDTVPPAAVAIARRCGEHFTVAGAAPRDLPDLFTLALMAGQDSLAQTVVARRLALARSTKAKDTVVLDAIDGYLAAEPSRLSLATAMVAQLDRRDPPDPVARLYAHQLLLLHAMARFDEPRMQHEAEQIIAIGHDAPTDQLQHNWLPLVSAYRALGMIANIEEPEDSLLVLMARAKQDLGRFPAGDPLNPGMKNKYREADLQTVRDMLVPFNAERFANATGAAFSRPETPYWFGVTPKNWPPGRGGPALVIYGGPIANQCARSDRLIFAGLTFDSFSCKNLYTYVSAWSKEYQGKLAITLIAQSQGFAVRSSVIDTHAEADTLNWFFRDHLKLPITFGMVTDSVWRLPAVDGRVYYIDTTAYGRRFPVAGPGFESRQVVLFYDERGTLRYVSNDLNGPLLQRLIHRALRAMATARDAQGHF